MDYFQMDYFQKYKHRVNCILKNYISIVYFIKKLIKVNSRSFPRDPGNEGGLESWKVRLL